MNKLKNFINASNDIASNPSFILNSFDEFMALYDIVDPEILHIDFYDNIFKLTLDTTNNAKKFKTKIDSYIEVSKYEHQYIIDTSIQDNFVFIKLIDKESRLI